MDMNRLLVRRSIVVVPCIFSPLTVALVVLMVIVFGQSQAEEQAAAVAELTSARNDLLAQIETRTAELASCTANLEESNLARGALHARVQQLEKVESDKLALQHEAAGLRRR